MKITQGKFNGINACADQRGVIAAVAMDQRGSLQKMISQARGEGGTASVDDLVQFKVAVVKVLTRYASAVLLDLEYGRRALEVKAPGAGVLISYEKSGYDTDIKGRLPDLVPGQSVRRLVEAGASAVKVLLYYNPADEAPINEIKQAFVERVGAECAANDVPFFLETLYYNDDLDVKGIEFARHKPLAVAETMAEFSKPQYRVDVFKVEIPVNMKFVEDTRAYTGLSAYTRREALEHFRNMAAASGKPFIYLSAGVSDEVFRESLELAAEAQVSFAGVLCGRATWQGGVPIYAKQGYAALEKWLESGGLANIQALNDTLARCAQPWWNFYGGKENITVHQEGRSANGPAF